MIEKTLPEYQKSFSELAGDGEHISGSVAREELVSDSADTRFGEVA